MPRGTALTSAEKYAIKGMINDGVSVKKMALHLRRTERFIQKYIDTELNIETKEIQTLDENAELAVNTPKRIPKISKEVFTSAFEKLVANGIPELDAFASLTRLKKKLKEPTSNVDAIVRYCENHLGPKNLMLSKSGSGKKLGATIMTHAASAMGDDVKESRANRDPSTYIFKQPDRATLFGEDEDDEEEISL